MIGLAVKMRFWCVVLALAVVGCQNKKQETPKPATTTAQVQTLSVSPDTNSKEENCGLNAYPASRSAQDMLRDVSQGDQSRSSTMLAKIAVDAEGKITHLRVLRLAYPQLPNSKAINSNAIESIKRWRYAPTLYQGKPVAVCSDVTVTIDFSQ